MASSASCKAARTPAPAMDDWALNRPVAHADGGADLVGAGAVHGLGLGGDAVDVGPGEAGVGERSAGGVDDEPEHGPVVLPGRFDFADSDDGNGHPAPDVGAGAGTPAQTRRDRRSSISAGA